MTTHAQTRPRLDPHLVYGVDAIVSAAMGVTLLATAEPLTQLLGWTMPAGFLWTIGLLLLPWAAFNAWIARTHRPARAAVRGNISGDAFWVVASIGLILLHMPSLSTIGLALLVGQAIAVAGVVALKLAGVRALA